MLILEGEMFENHRQDLMAREILEGKSVLVCCNTVKRAQRACEELKRRLNDAVEIILLHGRFNGRDRLRIEKKIQRVSGAGSDTRRPVVVVATQVVEVSLDIDLNVIYSDPAPLEALIQRFGRINRRRRQKWAPVNVFTEPVEGQQIYAADLVRRSLDVLNENDVKLLDESMIAAWLDRIYSGETAARWIRE